MSPLWASHCTSLLMERGGGFLNIPEDSAAAKPSVIACGEMALTFFGGERCGCRGLTEGGLLLWYPKVG